MPAITLTQGYEALVDKQDLDLARHSYHATVNGEGRVYAKRALPKGGAARHAYLHRDIAERRGPIPAGMVVDHINGNSLDNRRENLRVVTHRQNLWNRAGARRDSSSGVPGVRQVKSTGRWQSYICEGTKMRTLGTFATMEEARAARMSAEAARLETAA